MLAGENIGSRFVVPTVAACVDVSRVPSVVG
jgi:hypothetical protein